MIFCTEMLMNVLLQDVKDRWQRGNVLSPFIYVVIKLTLSVVNLVFL